MRTLRHGLKGGPGDWSRPDTGSLPFEFSIAESVLEEFVLSHDPSEVLRELVQNEFDAEGTRIDVLFGTDSVTVVGNGKSIDPAGWKRLSVVLGKGRVAGSNRIIQPKVNSIGSKNFGLRSLFLYGDQIFVRSGGKQTVLDLFRGALRNPIQEPLSRGRRGIQIDVPYRTKASGGLETFGPTREQQAVASFAQNLVSTLIKLARPGLSKSLREMVVSSQRCNIRIRWTQAASKVRTSARNVVAVRRLVRITQGSLDRSDKHRRQTIEEIEFQKSFRLPPEFQSRAFPSYFKVSGSRVRIGVSLRIQRGRPSINEPGLFFYPIGVSRGYTGNAVSVNAPFELNSDRTKTVDASNSPWNMWLSDKAAELTIELLSSDWLERFGAHAYLATRVGAQPAIDMYANAVKKRLAQESCWPTRAFQQGKKKRVLFAKASDLVIPDYQELDGFLSDQCHLDSRLTAVDGVRKMATQCGSKRFTLSSLVRLRCAGQNDSVLATKLTPEEANSYYTEFPNPLLNEELQERFGRSCDMLARKLSRENRVDLKNSPTTLTTDGNLKAPASPLWVVEPAVASATLVPKSDQLHPRLLRYKVLKNLCQPFDISRWARDIAIRAAASHNWWKFDLAISYTLLPSQSILLCNQCFL